MLAAVGRGDRKKGQDMDKGTLDRVNRELPRWQHLIIHAIALILLQRGGRVILARDGL